METHTGKSYDFTAILAQQRWDLLGSSRKDHEGFVQIEDGNAALLGLPIGSEPRQNTGIDLQSVFLYITLTLGYIICGCLKKEVGLGVVKFTLI